MHRRFAIEYLKDLKGPAAAIRTGYSKNPKSAEIQAWQLLKHPDVQAHIHSLLAEQRKAKIIDANRVLEEIERLAMVNSKDAFDEDGQLLPIGAMSDDMGRCISGFDYEELFDRLTGEKRGRVVKVKFWNKTDSLNMLAKYLRLWIEGTGSAKAPSEPVDMKWADEKTLRKLAEGK